MSVPAWKQAVLERRKKQEEEERKKQEQEEQYLSSLPPWKRAIVLRNREKSGIKPPSPKPPNKSVSKPPTQQTSSKQPTKPGASSQWQAAVQISVASSPTRQRPAWARTASPESSNSPKRTRSNLWERSSGQQNSVTVANRAHSFNVTTQVKNSPFMGRSNTSSNEVQLRNNSASSTKELIAEKRRSFETDTASNSKPETTPSAPSAPSVSVGVEDPALADMPAWKKALILRRRQQQQKLRDQQQEAEPQEKTEPPTKPAESLKPAVQENVVDGVDETDSLPPAVKPSDTPSEPAPPAKKSPEKKKSKAKASKSTTAKQDSKGTKKAKNKVKPEVVNRAAAQEENTGKLVTQEGVTLHPPVYKEVEQWANVSETDEKFLKLPAWKQALIRRRRADIAKRSGQNVPEEKTETAQTEPTKPVHTAWSPRNSVDLTKDLSTGPASTWKQDMLRKRRPTPPPSKVIAEEKIVQTTSSGRGGGRNVQSLLGKFSGGQPAAAPHRSSANKPGSNQHRVFSVGSAGSDSSDSELEDVVVTCIDEDDTSDEGDSGIDKGTAMRSRSAPTSPTNVSPTNTMTRSSSKSILINPEKKSFQVSHTITHLLTHTLFHVHTHTYTENEASIIQ